MNSLYPHAHLKTYLKLVDVLRIFEFKKIAKLFSMKHSVLNILTIKVLMFAIYTVISVNSNEFSKFELKNLNNRK